jgi:hypothetical protein
MTMPEISEVRIMSDFINQNSKNKFNKAFHVEKGNIPTQFLDKEFDIKSDSIGKELLLFIDEYNGWKFLSIENNSFKPFIKNVVENKKRGK